MLNPAKKGGREGKKEQRWEGGNPERGSEMRYKREKYTPTVVGSTHTITHTSLSTLLGLMLSPSSINTDVRTIQINEPKAVSWLPENHALEHIHLLPHLD